MSRPLIFGIIAMAAVVVASNILVQFLFGNWLTWGAFTYPFAFLVTDLTNRFLGKGPARQVVIAGFAVGVLCSVVAAFMGLTTLTIAIGSGTAFLIAQLVDVFVFDRLRAGVWWRAPLASTLIGSALDTALFFTIAFSALFVFLDPSDPNVWARDLVPLFGVGPVAPLWVSLALADWGIKLALALVALIPFGIVARRHA